MGNVCTSYNLRVLGMQHDRVTLSFFVVICCCAVNHYYETRACAFNELTHQHRTGHMLRCEKRSSAWMFDLTSLQFFVPMRRAMEQKLLKYVPCSTLNSDSSAPLHWTTQHVCSIPSSSPGRSLVGVWHREFPSVTHKHMEKHFSITDSLMDFWQKVCYIFF